MRVVVNRLPALGIRTGIGHYTVQLLRCLRAQCPPDRVEAYPRGLFRKTRQVLARLRHHFEGNGRQSGTGSAHSGRAGLRSRVLQHLRQLSHRVTARHFQVVSALHAYDIYHEPNFIPLPSSCLTLATLHDLSVVLHPEWHPCDRVVYFEKHFQQGLARCQHFLAISEFGRQEIIRTLGIPPERVTRTYMGIRRGLGPLPESEVIPVLEQLKLPPRYLLFLGTIEPRKNLLVLLEAYCALPAALRARWPLVLVGSWGWNAGPVAECLHGHARDRGVVHLGYVAEQHLGAIYNGARALVFPSLYEGFGLPPVEMMACGGAVLASTAGSLVETVGSRAHLIDPHDTDGWRAALQRVLEDDEWHRSLCAGVESVARPYTWERCAAETLQVYRRLAGADTPHPATKPAVPQQLKAAG